ncbi:hypothetical protein LCGC14_0385000 [marine sediment metagenome]|uniref:Uncharacterized protein n=1 Tax=marine sediment metagenome TaxID=412755 RepID=A0A0F9WA60_9ZZZZ
MKRRQLIASHNDFWRKWVEVNGSDESSYHTFCLWFASFVNGLRS